MAFISQGIFLPKKELLQQLDEAYNAFRFIAKHSKGQSLTQLFSSKAIEMKEISKNAEFMSKEQRLETLESLRHDYYEAADKVASQKLTIRLLKKAVETNALIQKERRHG